MFHSKKYNVIIVGAGPGGLKAAETLGKGRKSVLLLERNPEIGPKICARGLTTKDSKLVRLQLIPRYRRHSLYASPLFKTSTIML